MDQALVQFRRAAARENRGRRGLSVGILRPCSNGPWSTGDDAGAPVTECPRSRPH
jgi:hypothetical protein